MPQKVFYNYLPAGVATDAFAVTLSSEDASFGILRNDTNEIIIASGATVDHPDLGAYSYTFDPIPDTIYTIAWKVVGSSGDDPFYVTEVVGPFSTVQPVRAVADFKGSFNQGTWATLNLKIFDLGGSPSDASDITVTIQSADTGVVAVTGTPEKIGSGYYMFDWPLPQTQAVGNYEAIWKYKNRGVDRTVVQTLIVSSDETANVFHSAMMSLVRIVLERYIPALQAIPMFRLQADDTSDNKTYYFAFKHWNQSAGVRVYRSMREVTSGFTVDYLNGIVTFDKPNLESETIQATFNFRFFSDDALDTFLLQGLNKFNIFAPHTQMSFCNILDRYVPPVIYGAAVDALRTFLQQLMWPQYNVLYGTPERADKAYEQVESLKKDYEEEWKTLCEEKKKFPYKGLHHLIVQPWFTVPGGRARFARSLFLGNNF